MAIAKDAGERFQSANAFRGALGSLQLASAVAPGPVGVSTKTLLPRTNVAPPVPPPVPAPPALPKPAASALPYPGNKSRRGLYMAMGSLATIVVLAAAVIYGPKLFTSRADTTKTATVETKPSVTPAIQEPPPAVAATPVVEAPQQVASTQKPALMTPPTRPTRITPTQIVAPSMVTSTKLPGARAAAQTPVEIAQARPPAAVPDQQASPVAAAAPVSINTKELNEVRERFNNVSIRAAAMKDEMNATAQRMAAQGLTLRGDARTAETQVQYQLNEAMQYIRKGDVEHAKQALQYAEGSMAALAKAMGR
jgi:hypothetical protein